MRRLVDTVRRVAAGLGLAAVACVAQAQSAAVAPLWNLDYRDCAEKALTRLAPDASASTPDPQKPVTQAERDCADRLPATGGDTTPLTVNAAVAFVRSNLYLHFRPMPPSSRPRPTLDVGHGVTCPQPDYPPAALRAAATGKTQLELRVDASGRILVGNVIVASGNTREHRMLDGAALDSFAQCTIPPSGSEQVMRLAFVWRLE